MEACLLLTLRPSSRSSSERLSSFKLCFLAFAALTLAFSGYSTAAPTQKKKKIVPIALPASTPAPKPISAYDLLVSRANSFEKENHVNGWGYIVSGGAVLAISIPGYYVSKDTFAQVVYSVGQTLGVGAVSYGASLVLLDNEYTSFNNILKADPSLTPESKELLAHAFFHEAANRARQGRKIRFVFHSLTGGLNFLNAITTTSPDLRSALYFLGGINTLAAIHYFFSPSEEEKTAERLEVLEKPKVSVEPLIGPMFGLQVHF